MRGVFISNTVGLWLCPQFKILWTVIVSYSVYVMDRFRKMHS